jgi:hypothetical protein
MMQADDSLPTRLTYGVKGPHTISREVEGEVWIAALPDPGGYRGPPTFFKWFKIVFWPFRQFTIFNRFSLSGPF